jgi:hypothetical protein
LFENFIRELRRASGTNYPKSMKVIDEFAKNPFIPESKFHLALVLERKLLIFSTNKDAFNHFPFISSLIYPNIFFYVQCVHKKLKSCFVSHNSLYWHACLRG